MFPRYGGLPVMFVLATRWVRLPAVARVDMVDM
jgi:hypothetical protein